MLILMEAFASMGQTEEYAQRNAELRIAGLEEQYYSTSKEKLRITITVPTHQLIIQGI